MTNKYSYNCHLLCIIMNNQIKTINKIVICCLIFSTSLQLQVTRIHTHKQTKTDLKLKQTKKLKIKNTKQKFSMSFRSTPFQQTQFPENSPLENKHKSQNFIKKYTQKTTKHRKQIKQFIFSIKHKKQT